MALLKRKRSGLTDAMSVVTRFVNACNRHDADGVAACLHPDFDSIQPMYPTRNFRGADQVRRNWQAIFDAEPGFRLTVLRSATVDDTIWLELHGAGEEAEVAGVFVMGVVGDRIRWARIYSALVEPVPEGVGQPPPALREVPRHDEAPAAPDGEMVEESLIAPVLNMERGSRRRRRRARDDEAAGAEAAAPVPAPEPEPETPAATDDAEQVDGAVAADATAVAMVDGGTEAEAVVVVAGEQAEPEAAQAEPEAGVGAETAAVAAGGAETAAVAAGAGSDPDPSIAAAATADAGGTAAGPGDDDGGPPTEAVGIFAAEAEAEAQPEPTPAASASDGEPEPDPGGEGARRGLFGRKRP